ncbi:AlpA family transcriptional regulator [Chromobacterium violaceum]|uniref:helix-turn-helix transcriptional regulator n=1 Tax=Chromobacterium violaceum TaxID=536 RepID=UPI001BEB733A|nr:AlpA family transcriptional regulator [Chromobacterium violaceum]MBT2866543.1 AlpA family transcriptional regulator [Chromobacterium violaceum]
MADQSRNILTILRRKQVEARTGLSRSTIYDKLNAKSPRFDATFPPPISLGAGAVGWVEAEVTAWIESRITVSREAA